MSIGRRVLWLVPLIAGLFAPAAWACSCIPLDADQLVARAAVLFEGTMVGTGKPYTYSGCEDADALECVQHVRAIFRVDRILKGELGKTVTIRYAPPGGFGCGPAFSMNEPALVAVNFHPDGSYVTASECAMGVMGYGLEISEVTEALERYHERLDTFQAAIEAAPGNPGPLMEKARFLVETQDRAAALKLLGAVLAADPANRDAVLLTVKLRSDRREDNLALTALDSYLARNLSDQDALHARAVSLVRLGRVDAIQAGWRDFSKLTGEKLDLSSRAFDGASFREASLESPSFAGTSLKQADLSGVHMWNAVFDGVDLAGADLSNARMGGSFEGANFKGAKLHRAAFSFRGRIASLEGADLTGADFRSAGLRAMLADFRSERLRSGSLEEVNAVGVKALGARFISLAMVGADFSGADFRHAEFMFLDLSDASFRGASLEGASFRESDLTGVDLENANLRKASFRSSKLDGARLAGALFDSETAWPDGFDPIEAGARME